MEVLYIMVPLAIAFAGCAVLAFIWGVKSGQFDDMKTPGLRALTDDTTLNVTADHEHVRHNPNDATNE